MNKILKKKLRVAAKDELESMRKIILKNEEIFRTVTHDYYGGNAHTAGKKIERFIKDPEVILPFNIYRSFLSYTVSYSAQQTLSERTVERAADYDAFKTALGSYTEILEKLKATRALENKPVEVPGVTKDIPRWYAKILKFPEFIECAENSEELKAEARYIMETVGWATIPYHSSGGEVYTDGDTAGYYSQMATIRVEFPTPVAVAGYEFFSRWVNKILPANPLGNDNGPSPIYPQGMDVVFYNTAITGTDLHGMVRIPNFAPSLRPPYNKDHGTYIVTVFGAQSRDEAKPEAIEALEARNKSYRSRCKFHCVISRFPGCFDDVDKEKWKYLLEKAPTSLSLLELDGYHDPLSRVEVFFKMPGSLQCKVAEATYLWASKMPTSGLDLISRIDEGCMDLVFFITTEDCTQIVAVRGIYAASPTLTASPWVSTSDSELRFSISGHEAFGCDNFSTAFAALSEKNKAT